MRTATAHSEPRWTLKSVGRACEVLSAFSDRGQWTLSDLARELDEHKSVIRRTVMTLIEAGFLWRDPTGTYYLGGEFRRIGATAAVPSVVTLGHPLLEELAWITRETASISILRASRGVYLDIVNSPESMKFTLNVGESFSLNAGASGRVLLAYQSDQFIDQIFAQDQFDRYTNQTLFQSADIARELSKIRSAPYYYTDGEVTPEARSIAAPVLDAHGSLRACIAISGPKYRLSGGNVERLGGLVREQANRLTNALGMESDDNSEG